MGALTELNRKWLDSRFRRDPETKSYFAHEPIYGMSSKLSEPNHLVRYARLCAILSTLEKLPFKSLLDVGGAEGYLSYLVVKLFNARAVTSDLSFEANCRAAELFDVPGVVLQSADLPFESNCFDVVTCFETLEHVEYPIETLFELYRVAKRHVIISTEALCETEKEQLDRLANRKHYTHHFEKNWFLIQDFTRLFRNVLVVDYSSVSQYLSERIGDSSYDKTPIKLLLIAKKNDEAADREVAIQQVGRFLSFLLDQRFPEVVDLDMSSRQIREELLLLVRCPTCKSDLGFSKDKLVCRKCGEGFAVSCGVPILLSENRNYTEHDLSSRLRKDGYEREYVSKALGLRKKFDFDIGIDRRLRWCFDTPDLPWRLLADIKLTSIKNGFSEFEVTGNDPQLISPILALDLSSVGSIRIVCSMTGCESSIGQIFWATENDVGGYAGTIFEFKESSSIRFKVESEGFRSYMVPLQDDIPKSKFCRLRLDPTHCPARLGIKDIELLLKKES